MYTKCCGASVALILTAIPLAHAVPPPEPGSEPAAGTATAKAPVELATVDGSAITTADVEKALRMRYGRQLDAMPPEQRAMAIKQSTPQMTEELIARTLLLNAAKEAKVEVEAAEITKAIDEIKGSLPPQITFEDYVKMVDKDEAAFRASLTEELQIGSHVRARLDALPKASDEAVAKYYAEHKDEFVTEESVTASHILLKIDPAGGEDDKKAKLAEIEKLRQQLIDAKGEGFEALAKEHSDCPSSAQGGSLGQFGRGQMVPPFEKAAFGQKPGEVGEVVETQFGYHIVKVTEKTGAGQQPLDEVKVQIAEQIDGTAQQTAVRDYLAELEKAAKITRSETLSPPAPEAPPAPGAPPATTEDTPPAE